MAKVNYRLRDWGISRQRYWGAPIPVVYCPTDGMVPETRGGPPGRAAARRRSSSGKGGSPLAEVASLRQHARARSAAGTARRETDTMDTFVESSWYFLRYCSPHYEQGMFDSQAADYWMPVDQYIGGIEHAVLHLLYARFYTKVLRDLGLTKVDEPFSRAADARAWSSRTAPRCRSPRATSSIPTISSGRFGADTARLFSLFAAPPEKDLDWNDHGVEGASRFLNRVWRFVETHHDELTSAPSVFVPRAPLELVERSVAPARTGGAVGGGASPPPTSNVTTEDGKAFRRTIHETIKRVTDDIEGDFHFNTAVSAIMELVNALYAFESGARERVPAAERVGTPAGGDRDDDPAARPVLSRT